MAVNMQGTWCISLKSKKTRKLQKLEISGAQSGNGLYDLEQDTTPIIAGGEHWTIQLLQDTGSNFLPCREQIRFPYKTDGKYQFDVESAGINTEKTILSCNMPQSTSDFLIYGNISTYDEPCFFNPFYHFWIVLETREAFYEALKYNALRFAIKKLYLDRLAKEILLPNSERNIEEFIPLIIPLNDENIIPPSLGQVLKINKNSDTKTMYRENYTISTEEIVTLSKPGHLNVDINTAALCNLYDQVLPRTITEPLGNIELQFYEYIRTNQEFCGGPYTGEGKRKKLGSCISDESGNYLFHFSKSKNAYLTRFIFNRKLDKDSAFQFMPDVLIQLRDKENNRLIHETIPYWNLPLLKRINICFPDKKIDGKRNFEFSTNNLSILESKDELFVV